MTNRLSVERSRVKRMKPARLLDHVLDLVERYRGQECANDEEYRVVDIAEDELRSRLAQCGFFKSQRAAAR